MFYGKSGSCDGWNLFCDREIPGAGIWETVERLKVDGRMGWVGEDKKNEGFHTFYVIELDEITFLFT